MDNNKFKIGDVLQFHLAHIDPKSSRIATVYAIKKPAKYIVYKIFPSMNVRYGTEYKSTDTFFEGSALSINAKIIDKLDPEVVKILYGKKV